MPTKDQQKKLEFRKAVADRFLSLLDKSSENNDYKWIKHGHCLLKDHITCLQMELIEVSIPCIYH